MTSQTKGSRVERELVRLLDEAGFAVMRAPASGAATTRELPDVLAGNGKLFYAFEVKSSSKNTIYLTGQEVEALVYFSQNFGAKARIGVRFDREKWYFLAKFGKTQFFLKKLKFLFKNSFYIKFRRNYSIPKF